MDAKALLKDALGPAYDHVMAVVGIATPFRFPGNLFWPFLASALLLAAVPYAAEVRAAGGRPSARGFLAFLFPRRVFGHRSAWVDLKFYAVNSVVHRYLRISSVAFTFGSLLAVGEGVRRLLSLAFPAPELADPSLAARIGYSLAFVAAADFAKYVAHFLQHKVVWLWEFHKVHHSAEVLTFLTNDRVHPVDMILDNILTAVTTGAVVGLYGHFYGEGMTQVSLLGLGLFTSVSYFFANLRHSHIPLAYPRALSHVLSSPVMHQIHHSYEVRHWDRNYAVIFSLWDTLFRTAYIPRGREEFRLGIGPESAEFKGVLSLYAYPFLASARRLRAKLRPAPVVPAEVRAAPEARSGETPGRAD